LAILSRAKRRVLDCQHMTIDRRGFLAGALSLSIFPSGATHAQSPAPARSEDGFVLVEAKQGEARLRGPKESATKILGYGGEFPPKILRLKKGEELRLRLRNSLAEPTTLHIRGMRGPNAFDGVAPLTQQAVAPGASQDIRFTPPDSGHFYFHPHGPNAAEQAGRGLGGMLIVDEEPPLQVDHEFMFALADWELNDAGEMRPHQIVSLMDAGRAGRLGSHMTINGSPAPFAQEARPGARIRLRFVNMCMAQLAALTFDNTMPMIVAVDSQPCKPFEPVNKTFPMGPGARFDIFFDMPEKAGGQVKIALRRWPIKGVADVPPQDVAVFTARGDRRPALPPVAPLPDNTALPPIIPLQNARRMDLTIEPHRARGLHPERLWTFNGTSMSVANTKPLFSVKRGTPVSFGFINKSEVPHVMRVHGHVMRQLHLLDDGWEPYWRDGVIVPEGRTVRVAFLADNPGKWRVGSGILAHAESGLSAWFEVT
jgi:FtsP/CotA-like multicopper oxidase with cupredoxin domain